MHEPPDDSPFSRGLRWLIVVVLTGVMAGLTGLALATLLHTLQHLAYGYDLGTIFSGESFLDGVSTATPARRVAVLAVCGVVAGAGWWAVYRFGRPLVSIAKAVHGPQARMPLVTTACHALLQIVTVALGSPLGREVAPREIAAALAGALSERAGLTLEETRVMVACGAGAGLAAVYNVPLSGACFVLEGLLATFGWRALVPAVATSVVAALVARTGLGNLPQYAVPHYAATASLMSWAALAGPVFGAAAFAFGKLTASARAKAPRDWRLAVLCILNFAFIGLLAVRFPQLLGNGKGPAQAGFDGTIAAGLAAVLLVLRVLITWTSLRAGAGGGLLTPALCNGALLAIVLGAAWSAFWPGTPLGAFAVTGAAAFLATSMRVPLTAVLLVFEFTEPAQSFLVPVMFAVAGSVAASEAMRRAMAAREKSLLPDGQRDGVKA